MRYIIFPCICFVLLLCLPVQANARQLMMSARDGESAQIGGRVLLDIELVIPEEPINGVSGEIVLPDGGIVVEDIFTGNSAISFWVQKPLYQRGIIRFSGINPGGIPKTDKVMLFTIALRTNLAGEYLMSARDVSVFRNDGFGTRVAISAPDLAVRVRNEASTVLMPALDDTTAPEPFIVYVVRAKEIGKGERSLLFHTSDNGSGVKRYILKTDNGIQKTIESPYIVEDDIDLSAIQIVAEDHYGNQTIGEKRYQQVVDPKNTTSIVFIIVLFLFGIIVNYFILPKITQRT